MLLPQAQIEARVTVASVFVMVTGLDLAAVVVLTLKDVSRME